MTSRARNVLVCVILVLGCGAIFGQVTRFELINRDDPYYITDHPNVREGFTRQGVWVLLSETHVGNWHPVTSLTHMLDVELFGLDGGGHHGTNLLLHVVNSLLVFLVLLRMTGAWFPSALVAALFAWHPLHVESVAWVSQRKDLLSTTFWLLAMGAYEVYARRPSLARYIPLAVFLALGLLSKGMLVTFPFVLLLLDYWPLGRLWCQDEGRYRRGSVGKLVWEKVPLFALSAMMSILTFLVQSAPATMVSVDSLPLVARASNAVNGYAGYLYHTIWPFGLIPHYPHPGTDVNWLWTGISLGVLVGITVSVVALARRFRFLPVGWFWFGGSLVPVIGLVQVGSQAMADRYTYVSLLGVFIAVAWGLHAFTIRWPRARTAVWLGAAGVVVACGFLSWKQTGHWRDSETLWRHNLAHRDDNALPHVMLGYALLEKQEYAGAETAFLAARERSERPGSAQWAERGLGQIDFEEGRIREAMGHFQATLAMDRDAKLAAYYLGKCYLELGQAREAEPWLREALEHTPNSADCHDGLGVALGMMGQAEESERHLREAIRLRPERGLSHANLGSLLANQGELDEALASLERALTLLPAGHEKRGAIEGAVEAVRGSLTLP